MTDGQEDEFLSRASASAAAAVRRNPAEVVAKSITEETPKIESAVKAYLSLAMARSFVSGEGAEAAASSPSAPVSPSSQIGLLMGRDETNNLRDRNEPADDGSAGSTTAVPAAGKSSGVSFAASFKPPTPPLDSKVALALARALLRAINEYRIPPSDGPSPECTGGEGVADRCYEEALERRVVGMVWNGLVDSGQKPTKILGRTALDVAYPQILESVLLPLVGARSRADGDEPAESVKPQELPGVSAEQGAAFFQGFGRLLAQYNQSITDCTDHDEDDDSALLWDKDGGARELARRKARRKEDADGRRARAAVEAGDEEECVSANDRVEVIDTT